MRQAVDPAWQGSGHVCRRDGGPGQARALAATEIETGKGKKQVDKLLRMPVSLDAKWKEPAKSVASKT